MFLNAFSKDIRKKRFRVNPKSYLIMKLTTLLCMVALLQASANGFGQQITIREEKTSLLKIFKEIEQQTQYTFLYHNRDVENIVNVSINVNNASLDEVLKTCLDGKSLTYKIIENTVLVKKREVSTPVAAPPEMVEAADIIINGRVTDDIGNPLPNVNVTVKGSLAGTSTDAEGRYSISFPEEATLVFSFLGYESQEVNVVKSTTLNISLHETASDLEEVVVVGYGEQKKATITGSISTVSGETLETAPTINFTNSLAGRLPGLTSVTGGSEPGKDDSNLRIRGSNTLGDNSPLIVIDGVANRSMTRLNPADILSVTILKDASAAIYGAQAANGVILVTTKRGKIGRAHV